MALSIPIKTPYGIDATYWRIHRATDHYTGTVEIIMGGFIDAEHAELHVADMPLQTIKIYVGAKDASRGDLYPLIKQQEPFIGAVDV